MLWLRGHRDVMREVRVEVDGLLVGPRPSRGSLGRGRHVEDEQDQVYDR